MTWGARKLIHAGTLTSKAMILLALMAAATGCSDRERSNPLDPGNPDRDRSNLGFNALAGNDQVLLEWDVLDFIDLAGIRVRRIENGATDTVTVSDSTLPHTATRFVDNTVSNGTTYSYHLMFDVEGGDEKPTTLPDTVTPGPVFSWVELIDYGEVVLFTPDFRDEVTSLELAFFDVVDIQVGSTIWVLEGGGAIHRFERNGNLISSGDILNVSAFTFDPGGFSIWVAQSGENGTVYRFRQNGELEDSKVTGLRVTSLAVDVRSNSLWVGSSDPAISRELIPTDIHTQFAHSEFVSPELVVTAPREAGAWVGDHGSDMVFHYGVSGFRWSAGGFSEVNDLAVNDDGSLCWVADALADEVVVLNGMTGDVIETFSGMGNPFYLTFNRATDRLLVSGSTGLITCISERGDILWTVQNPDRTGKIVLAY